MRTDRDLNDIEVFVNVVEERSFTGAGKRLGMPRSTVSRRIAELERRLGARLLHRTTRKLRLTEIGSRYYERCAAGLTTIEDAEACVRAANETPRGRVRVTAPYSMEGLLGGMVARFLRQHPEVTIEVELTQRFVDMIAENFDLAIRATGHLPDSTLIARPIGTGHAQLYTSHAYLAERGVPQTPEELIDHTTVTYGRQHRVWTLRDKAGRTVEAHIRPRLEVNDPSLALTAVLAGFGITILPFDFGAKELVPVLPEYLGPSAARYLVYPSAKLMSASMRAVRDHFLEEFATENNRHDAGRAMSVAAIGRSS